MFGMHPPRMQPRRQRRGDNANISPMLIMLAMRVYQWYEEQPIKPPVTVALLAFNIAAHVYPAMVLPFSVSMLCCGHWEVMGDWYHGDLFAVALRIVGSCFAHADDMHLYYNMGSLMVKGLMLELSMGSEAFGVFVAFSVVVSQLLSVVLGRLLENSLGYASGCAVGFSGVLFSMKLVLNYGAHAPGSAARSQVWGVKIASRHAHWLEILISSYLSPRSSLLGHACGALAGWLWLVSADYRAVLAAKAKQAARDAQRGDRYTYAAGTAARPAPAPAPEPEDDDGWEPVDQPVPPASAPGPDRDELRRRRAARFG